MKLNEKILKLRKMKGLTQDEFAAAVGVSRQAVYKWESGQSYPEVPKLLEMKILFEISIDDLLDDNYIVVTPEKQKKKRAPREKKAESVISQASGETAPKKEEPAFAARETKVREQTPAVNEIPDTKEVPAAASEPQKEEKKAEEKKVGFFGRLFGRK